VPELSLERIFTAYIMLDPKQGVDYLHGVLRSDSHSFSKTYSAIKTMRFFWDERKDVVKEAQLLEGYALALAQPVVADYAIEDLMRRSRWEFTDRVFDLVDKKSHDWRGAKRAILRFALQCGKSKSPPARCLRFIDEQRRVDPSGGQRHDRVA
jgi:hypothetical protein